MRVEYQHSDEYAVPKRAAISWRQALLRGVGAVTPLLLGVIPFGLIYGVLALNARLPATMAQGMSMIIFAGSAQFITTQLVRDGAPLLVLLATAAIVNLRHMLYSASLAPYLQHLGLGWKALLAYLLTDEAYAVVITRYVGDNPHSTQKVTNHHWYFLGAGLGLWITWQISTAVGIFLGAQIPASWSLDFAMPLTFIAIVVPVLKDRPMIVTALVAGVAILLTLTMPLKLGLVTAMMLGIGAGFLVERWLGVATDDKMAR